MVELDGFAPGRSSSTPAPATRDAAAGTPAAIESDRFRVQAAPDGTR